MSSVTTQSYETSAPWSAPATVEELFPKLGGHQYASINSAVAGARLEKTLPVGSARFQLYSHNTPNGQKVGILLEELGADYDAHGNKRLNSIDS